MSNFHCPNCGGSDLHEHEHRIWNCYGCGDDWHEDSLDHESARRQLSAAKAVIDKLPKTADRVPVVPGAKVYKCWWNDRSIIMGLIVVCIPKERSTGDRIKLRHMAASVRGYDDPWQEVSECYSTRKAARIGYDEAAGQAAAKEGE